MKFVLQTVSMAMLPEPYINCYTLRHRGRCDCQGGSYIAYCPWLAASVVVGLLLGRKAWLGPLDRHDVLKWLLHCGVTDNS